MLPLHMQQQHLCQFMIPREKKKGIQSCFLPSPYAFPQTMRYFVAAYNRHLAPMNAAFSPTYGSPFIYIPAHVAAWVTINGVNGFILALFWAEHNFLMWDNPRGNMIYLAQFGNNVLLRSSKLRKICSA